jgi:hypothetical protein
MIHKMSRSKKLFLAVGLLSLVGVGANVYGSNRRTNRCVCRNVIDNTNVNVDVNVNVQEIEDVLNDAAAAAEDAINNDVTLSQTEKEQQTLGVRKLAERSADKLSNLFKTGKAS